MRQGIQRTALAVGRTGCYLLSVLSLAEELGAGPVQPLQLFDAFFSRGWIGEDAFMQAPAEILGFLTGRRWWVKKAGPGHELALTYELKPGEYEILRFERDPRPGEAPSADTAHFVRGTGVGPFDARRILWDPFPGSQAVTAGRLASRRIFGRLP